MKKLIILILSVFSSLTWGQDVYYVSPTGDDTDPGTLAEPWATWGKAFNDASVGPGDTVYFRGGVYYKDISIEDGSNFYPSVASGGTGYGITRDGTAGNYIHYWAYPPDFAEDNPPILDHNDQQNTSAYIHGIRGRYVNYVKFYGLQLRNVSMKQDGAQADGFSIHGNEIHIINCKVTDIHGAGFEVGTDDGVEGTVYVTNCDASYCIDSLSSSLPGNDGSGFRHIVGGSVYYKGCRAWMCGDQGFSNGVDHQLNDNQYTDYDSCWAFINGNLEGGGSGFKFGWVDYVSGEKQREYRNCLGVWNRWNGWKSNDGAGDSAVWAEIYNCVAFNNGVYGGLTNSYDYEIHNTPDTDEHEYNRIIKNCISLGGRDGAVNLGTGAVYTHSNNTWDSEVTVTADDFKGPLDSASLIGALIADRGSDGSLPYVDNFNLVAGSDLIDAGTDVGMAYEGDAPDIGWLEYTSTLFQPDTVASYQGKTLTWFGKTVTASASMIPSPSGNTESTGNEDHFNVIYELTFDDWGNDASFTTSDMESYVPGTYSVNYMQTPAIVSDEINGESTSVLRITHAQGYPTSEDYYSGLDWKLIFANEGDNYTDLYLSYNLKLGRGAISTPDLKLPGFKTYPQFGANSAPDPGYGYTIKGYAQYQFEFNTYVYDRTYYPDAPWAIGESLDSVYLIPGVWYNITERLTQNEYGSYNGVVEFAIDGIWSNQGDGLRVIVDDTATINGIGIGSWTGGGWDDGNQLIDTYYMYVDNFTVWTPKADDVYGTRNYHNPDNIYIVPDSIVDRDLDYDGSIITTETTITNTEWGGYYSAGVDEQYLIDAGAGNTVTITANSGGVIRDRDILLITNGKTSDAGVLGKISGRSISSGESFTSGGRYMHLWFGSWNEGGGYEGWSFNITFNP